MKKAPKKSVTIDDLAGMVKQGFDSNDKQLKEFRSEVALCFNEVELRLGRIEKLTLADHRRRIEHLEIEVRRMKDLLAFQ